MQVKKVKDIDGTYMIGAGCKVIQPEGRQPRIEATQGQYMEAAYFVLHKRDPHKSGKLKLAREFNALLDRAQKLGLVPAEYGLAGQIAAMLEGRESAKTKRGHDEHQR